jgi:hypothetical protein
MKLSGLMDRSSALPSDSTVLCISASVTIFDRFCLDYACGDFPIVHVTFDPGTLVTTFAANCFSELRSLKSICIPASTQILSKRCFLRCRSLESLTFDSVSTLSRIGEQAFLKCSSLTSIFIPASVGVISSYAFARCRKLRNVEFESGSKLRHIFAGAFSNCYALKSISIPASVESVLDNCFRWCTSLDDIQFASPISALWCETFHGCESLKSICVPASVKMITDECFSGCTSLESVTFESPSQVAYFYGSSFYECESLKSICVPASLVVFEGSCFNGCTSLSVITFESPSLLQAIQGYLPDSVSQIDVPDSVKYIACETHAHNVLNIGPDSQLERFHVDTGYHKVGGAFVRFSEAVLKRWRSHPELSDVYSGKQMELLKMDTDDIIESIATALGEGEPRRESASPNESRSSNDYGSSEDSESLPEPDYR